MTATTPKNAPKSSQNLQGKSGTNVIKIASIIGIVFIVIFVIIVILPIWSSVSHSDIKIIDHNLEHTAGMFSVDYVLSGRVVNSGGGTSHPITLNIAFSDNNGNIIYNTTTSPEPSILGPSQEGSFSKHFTDSDIGKYTGSMSYKIQVISE